MSLDVERRTAPPEGAPEMPKRYSTRDEAIEQAIVPALGEYARDYDTAAMCADLFAYLVDTDQHGNELLNTAGFEQVGDADLFWLIAAKHERTAG